jgi:hypothetical protein
MVVDAGTTTGERDMALNDRKQHSGPIAGSLTMAGGVVLTVWAALLSLQANFGRLMIVFAGGPIAFAGGWKIARGTLGQQPRRRSGAAEGDQQL